MISVVIPLYNKAPHIVGTLESVFAQTVPPQEIIVVDDGSTDGGSDLVEPYVRSHGVRLIRQANAGVSAARNRGLREAVGEYVAFLDADDQWLPCHIEVLARLIAIYPEASLFSTAHVIEREGVRYRPRSTYSDGWFGLVDDFFRRYACGLSLIHPITACAKREDILNVGAFPVGVRRGEDIICWVNMALKYKVAHAEVVTAVYCHDAVNRTDRLREIEAPGSLMHIAKLLKGRDIDDGQRKGLWMLFDRIAFFTAAGFKLNGDNVGMEAIRGLAWNAGRYWVGLAISALMFVPKGFLRAVRKVRHPRVTK